MSHGALAARKAFESSAKVPGLSLATLPASAALPALPLPGIQLSQATGTGRSVMLVQGLIMMRQHVSLSPLSRYLPAQKKLGKLGILGIQYCNVLQCLVMCCRLAPRPLNRLCPTNMTPPPAAANIGHVARADFFNLVQCTELKRNQNKSKVGFWKTFFNARRQFGGQL